MFSWLKKIFSKRKNKIYRCRYCLELVEYVDRYGARVHVSDKEVLTGTRRQTIGGFWENGIDTYDCHYYFRFLSKKDIYEATQ